MRLPENEEYFKRVEQEEADRQDAFRVVAGTREGRIVLSSILATLGFNATVQDMEQAGLHNAAHEIFRDIVDFAPEQAATILREMFIEED